MKQAIYFAISVFASLAIGFAVGNQPELCRGVVLNDIQKHNAYVAQLNKQVSSDFLTVLGK